MTGNFDFILIKETRELTFPSIDNCRETTGTFILRFIDSWNERFGQKESCICSFDVHVTDTDRAGVEVMIFVQVKDGVRQREIDHD